MNNNSMKNYGLDALLARSTPPSASSGSALDASISALVDEAAHASHPPRWRRRGAIAGIGIATVLVSGVAVAAMLPQDDTGAG